MPDDFTAEVFHQADADAIAEDQEKAARKILDGIGLTKAPVDIVYDLHQGVVARERAAYNGESPSQNAFDRRDVAPAAWAEVERRYQSSIQKFHQVTTPAQRGAGLPPAYQDLQDRGLLGHRLSTMNDRAYEEFKRETIAFQQKKGKR